MVHRLRSKSLVRGRDIATIAKPRFHIPLSRGLPLVSPRSVSKPIVPLTLVEDRRFYNPQSFNALSLSGKKHILTVPKRAPARAGAVYFRTSANVVLCVRRKRRREVIHALGHAGRRGQRRPRRNAFSQIFC